MADLNKNDAYLVCPSWADITCRRVSMPIDVGYRIQSFDMSKYRIFDTRTCVVAPPSPGIPVFFMLTLNETFHASMLSNIEIVSATRFPFGVTVDLKPRGGGCRKLKRENTEGVFVPRTVVPATYSFARGHLARTKSILSEKLLKVKVQTTPRRAHYRASNTDQPKRL